MEEIRLNVGYLWQNITNIESDIQHINWNIISKTIEELQLLKR